MKEKQKVLYLLGATGIGKSGLAVKLAKKYNMEIISADSVQVYKGFDIGSAKITKKEMSGVMHYGIDIVLPNDNFSVSDFVNYTKDKIKEISCKGKLPLVVGGTGLYIKAFVEGYNLGGTERHEDFRKELEELAQKEGLDYLYLKLKSLSPKMAENIDKNNKVRLIRALEIATFGEEKQFKNVNDEFDFKLIALSMNREKLYQRINSRVDLMLKSGLIEEVKNLYDKYGDCQPMKAIGYKETLSYLKGKITKEEMINLISQHTRNYAKRQLTFLRGMKNISYFDVEDKDFTENLEKEINIWLAN